MSAYKMEEFIMPTILLKFMNRISCEKLNKFHEKYLMDNQKVAFYAFPSFPVIDRHSWFALYDERVESFYVNNYKKFIDDVTKIAKECCLTPRAVDCSLCQMGREKITLYRE